MKACKFCCEEIKDAAQFCPHCRKRQGTHPFTAFVAAIFVLLGVMVLIGAVGSALVRF